MAKKLHGVHVPHFKNTADMSVVRTTTPPMVIIPVSMHIGAPAKLIVKVGDEVKKGQKIAEANGFVSAPIYASVSGTVKKIEDIRLSNGNPCPAVFIESSEVQEIAELTKPEITDFDSFISAVRESGVVGLGGAGFPTAVKLKVDPDTVDYICFNGAECEPFITTDTRIMMEDTELLTDGIEILHRFYPKAKVFIGIEDNKPDCIKKLRNATGKYDYVTVKALKALYPQGGEKVLIYNLTGRIVPEGGLPITVGCIVLNTTTVANIMRYINGGKPLVSKYITVDGSAIKNPMNVKAPIGTPIKDIIEFTGGLKKDVKKILYGGPMMGISVPSDEEVVLKNTNAIICLDEKDAIVPEATACIHCGSCVDHCPFSLMPTEIEQAYEKNDAEKLAKLKVNLCMECGCCSYVCPAKHRLVETNKKAKELLNTYLKEKQAELKRKEEKKEAAK